MRSLAERGLLRQVRKGIERGLRATLILALLAAIYLSLTSMSERPSVAARGDDVSVGNALREWSTSSSPRVANLHFGSSPSAVTRAWTAALRSAGTDVGWASSLPAIAVSVEPVPDPKGASRVFVSAPARAHIALQDSLGVIDSVSVKSEGASIGPLLVHGVVRAALGQAAASSARSDSLIVRPVLVIGRAGWEGKFLVTALEEYGWHVNARFTVSPGNDATLGAVGTPIDTSNYSAVIVLDSSASRFAPAIIRYVRNGGGLITLGEGASLPALQQILPASAASPSSAGEFNQARPREALALRPLLNLKSDGIPLEKRGNRVAIAARLADRGRVVQVGYEDVWRWRMAGAGDAVEDERNWISAVLSSAAYAPKVALAAVSADPAPMAALFESLGEPSSAANSPRPFNTYTLLVALFILAITALVIETASRRLDGRP